MLNRLASTIGIIPPPKILLVGGDSLIGSVLYQRFIHHGFNVTTTTRRRANSIKGSVFLDLGHPETFDNIPPHFFDSVVLCGAVTALNACEESPEQTRVINVDGTIALTDYLSQRYAQLLYLSTNMVFDGKMPFAKPFDERKPTTEYGRQKLAVEDYLLLNAPKSAIIRFGKVLSPNNKLIIDWIAAFRAGSTVRPHEGKSVSPISLDLATEILFWLIINKKHGMFQFTAKSDMTYTEVAQCVARLIHSNPDLIVPMSLSRSDNVNPFPACPSFTTLKMSTNLSPWFSPPPPHEAIEHSIARYIS